MKLAWALLPVFLLAPAVATADEPTAPRQNPYSASSPPGAPVTIGAGPETARNVPDEGVVGRARELLNRARFLDEAAANDEKTANDLAARLPNLRIAAKAARDRAERAKDPDRDALLAKAEDLEAEVAVSEAELTLRKHTAVEDRRVARELRQRAVRLVREAPEESSLATACDPPYRFTADGRKIYRIECLR
jgi:hypothetical protein